MASNVKSYLLSSDCGEGDEFRGGDTIFVEFCRRFREGDIVLLEHNGRNVLARVYTGKSGFELRDIEPGGGRIFPFETCKPLGVVIGIKRRL